MVVCVLGFGAVVWISPSVLGGQSVWPNWGQVALVLVTGALAAYDLRYQILPNALVAVFALINVGLVWWCYGLIGLSLIGGIVGYGFFWAVRHGMYLATGRIGLGLGDVKLLGAIGLGVGPFALSPIVLVAAVFGLVTAFVFFGFSRLTGRALKADMAVAFGPFLVVGYWASIMFPELFMHVSSTSARLAQWGFMGLIVDNI